MNLFIWIYGKLYGKCEFIAETIDINKCIQSEVFPLSRQYHTFEELYNEITNTKEVIVLGIFADKHSNHFQQQFFRAVSSLGNSVNFRHIYIDSVSNVYDIELIKNLKDYSLPHILLIRPKHLWNKFETNFVSLDRNVWTVCSRCRL